MVAKHSSTRSLDNWVWVQWSDHCRHQIDIIGLVLRYTHTSDGLKTGEGTVEQEWVQWSPDCCLSSVMMVKTLQKLFLIKTITLATDSKFIYMQYMHVYQLPQFQLAPIHPPHM